MKFIPSEGRLVLKSQDTTKSVGGIIIPGGVTAGQRFGEVVETSIENYSGRYSVGDLVLYKTPGILLKVGSEAAILIEEKEILGKLVDTD